VKRKEGKNRSKYDILPSLSFALALAFVLALVLAFVLAFVSTSPLLLDLHLHLSSRTRPSTLDFTSDLPFSYLVYFFPLKFPRLLTTFY